MENTVVQSYSNFVWTKGKPEYPYNGIFEGNINSLLILKFSCYSIENPGVKAFTVLINHSEG